MVYISALCYFFLMCENSKIGHLSSYQISIQMKANINPSPKTGLAPGISESDRGGVNIDTRPSKYDIPIFNQNSY